MSLIEDIKKPFNIIMLAVAIVAIVLSIFFYSSSIKKKEPVYSISETQLQIYNSNLSTDNIKVLDKNGNQIKKNIFVTTLTFWNNGQLGIDSADVKKPISFMLTDGAKLIDYKIIKAIHSEIARYTLSTDSTNQGEKILLSWSYLDAGFGVEIQIMYSNRYESSIVVDGYISEANLEELKISKIDDFNFGTVLIIIACYGIGLYSFQLFYKKIRKSSYYYKRGFIITLIGAIIITILTAALLLFLILIKTGLFGRGTPF